MLHIARSMKELDFSQLMDVYLEGNQEKAEEGLSLAEAERDFWEYLNDCFFPVPGAFYAMWLENGRYVSALRLEPYRDGWLLEALETAPMERRKGYAERLVTAVLAFAGGRIYSHVAKSNAVSLAVHEKCGFEKIADHAVYIDGSVNRRCCTLCAQGCGLRVTGRSVD